MVGRAITLYSEHKAAGFFWMAHGQVDFEASRPDLRVDLEAELTDSVGNFFFEWTIVVGVSDQRHTEHAGLSVTEIALEHAGAFTSRTAQIDVARVK